MAEVARLKAALRAAARAATHASPAARAACSWRPSAPERAAEGGGREERPRRVGAQRLPRGSLACALLAYLPKLAGDPSAASPCRCSS